MHPRLLYMATFKDFASASRHARANSSYTMGGELRGSTTNLAPPALPPALTIRNTQARQLQIIEPLEVTAGTSVCAVTNGSCVTDGADNYGNNERCTVRANVGVLLTSTQFATERNFDYVTIGGTRYSGTSGPDAVPLAAAHGVGVRY
jgi:hypothetical protein